MPTLKKEELPEGHVKVIITKVGHKRVAKGTTATSDDHFEWRDEVVLPRANAEALEKRGFVEIDEPIKE